LFCFLFCFLAQAKIPTSESSSIVTRPRRLPLVYRCIRTVCKSPEMPKHRDSQTETQKPVRGSKNPH
jgi:hypothetical protein